jgi:indole-3-glycerol phosphate synthase
MSNILDLIIADKRQEVALKKSIFSAKDLEKSPLFTRQCHSLKHNLQHSASGIIAEHKRRSPSKAVINQSHSVATVVKGYTEAGVCGISVLTDGKYFGGSLDDLVLARASTHLPLLRKEFVIDSYQILEAKAYGADLILLIAAVLNRAEIQALSTFAQSLGMEVLLEVHDKAELEKSIMPSLDMIGVNNRNLKTFEVSLDTSISLAKDIPNEFVKVSESGIGEVSAVKMLQNHGYRGFLMGEHFMKTTNPGGEAKIFIDKI